MLVKTISVKNPKNVVLQVPGFVSSLWDLKVGSKLSMEYDNEKDVVTIRPYVQGRGSTSEKVHTMA